MATNITQAQAFCIATACIQVRFNANQNQLILRPPLLPSSYQTNSMIERTVNKWSPLGLLTRMGGLIGGKYNNNKRQQFQRYKHDEGSPYHQNPIGAEHRSKRSAQAAASKVGPSLNSLSQLGKDEQILASQLLGQNSQQSMSSPLEITRPHYEFAESLDPHWAQYASGQAQFSAPYKSQHAEPWPLTPLCRLVRLGHDKLVRGHHNRVAQMDSWLQLWLSRLRLGTGHMLAGGGAY